MIFITLGSQKFQFDRLLKKIDELIIENKINDEVYAQIGHSNYEPQNYENARFMSREEFSEKMSESEIVITHGGTGAIINAIKKEKKVIAVPRQEKYGEHVDNHQSQIVDQFQNMELISSCVHIDDLEKKIEEINTKKFKKYNSSTNEIILSIEKFINQTFFQ